MNKKIYIATFKINILIDNYGPQSASEFYDWFNSVITSSVKCSRVCLLNEYELHVKLLPDLS